MSFFGLGRRSGRRWGDQNGNEWDQEKISVSNQNPRYNVVIHVVFRVGEFF